MGKEVQLAKRKHGVFLKATDPHVLDKAFKGVYTAWVAVLAVLKIQFAQMVALGAAIGDFVAQLLRVPATQVMVHVTPGWCRSRPAAAETPRAGP